MSDREARWGDARPPRRRGVRPALVAWVVMLLVIGGGVAFFFISQRRVARDAEAARAEAEAARAQAELARDQAEAARRVAAAGPGGEDPAGEEAEVRRAVGRFYDTFNSHDWGHVE